MIVLAIVNRQLLFEILERIEFVGSIEIFVVFAVGTFDLAIVSWSERLNELVLDAEQFQLLLEQVRSGFIGNEFLCEFSSVVSLNAENSERCSLDQMLEELGR